MRNGIWLLGGWLSLTLGCNSLDKPTTDEGVRVIVPVDARPAVQALHAPPISGGTLSVSPGGFAIAADPDRDRISIIELQTGVVRHIALNPGDEPGRVISDQTGRAYVALRRSGDVVSVVVASAQIESRAHACGAARGLALDPALGVVHVACADGRLVTLSAAASESQPASLALVRELNLDVDLRDVMVRGDQLLVSTFKTASLLEIDAAGVVADRTGASEFRVMVPKQLEKQNDDTFTLTSTFVEQRMSSHLAWRTALGASGEVVMLHQGSSREVVDLDHLDEASPSQSPYGGSGTCGAIVGPALTSIDATGNIVTVPLSSGVLSVDMAVTPRASVGFPGASRIAIVQAGSADPNAPRPTTLFDDDAPGISVSPPSAAIGGPVSTGPEGFQQVDFSRLPDGLDGLEIGSSGVTIIDSTLPGTIPVSDCLFGPRLTVPGQATAVAFSPAGDLIVQSREPALLSILSASRVPFSVESTGRVIALGGESARDTGHEIFHRDAGGGVACASCHAEGGEDGHTWRFSSFGDRRTQAMYVGLEGTEPFHWNGDESNLGAIMDDVFVARMGGVHQSSARTAVLQRWLFGLTPPAPIEPTDSPAAVRGKELFESAATGCTACHTGVKFTNNATLDVGTGARLQVPSLRGVGYRAPLMHSGCAARLEDRFDPGCGGAAHGNTAQLNPGQIGDMVAYLRTL